MARLLILLGASVLLWQSLRSVARQLNGEADRPPPSPGTAGDKSTERVAGRLVRCAQCGVHLPQERAVLDHGQTYCGETCQAQAAPASAS